MRQIAPAALAFVFLLPIVAQAQEQEELRIENPLPGAQVGAGYALSRLHPLFNERRPHEGIDLDAIRGTPVLAAAAGTVESTGSKIGYGTVVVIDHGAGYITRYAHLDSITVEQGQLITQTQQIGTVGRSGWATYHHLHFEVLFQGVATDPRPFVAEWLVPPNRN